VKERGNPDELITVAPVDRPEPQLDSADFPEEDSGVSAPKSSKPKDKKVKIEPDGNEPQVNTTLEKIYAKLRDTKELFKLHLKHYHMSSANFRKRTSALKLPKDILESYDQIVNECISCQKYVQAPTRSKVTGMRATTFGDLWFLDHFDITVDQSI